MTEDYMLQMVNISKSYPGVKALDQVNFSVRKGEVHGLMGENGAGKSTLMKILIGLVHADRGDIYMDGKLTKVKNVHAAMKEGLSMIHQELMPFIHLSVAENIYMGSQPAHGILGLIDKRKMNQDASVLLKRIGCTIGVTRPMKELSIAEMQMVEIAKAISHDARVIIMDEPTSAITQEEVESLFRLIRDLKSHGISIIYISHKMDEILGICDRISVLRDGHFMGTYETGQIDMQQLIKLIVGRELINIFDNPSKVIGDTVLTVHNISGKHFQNISLHVRKGEILGLAGLMGSGRTDIVNAIFGLEDFEGGYIALYGQQTRLDSPKKAIRNRIGLVSEDRKKFGLVLNQSVKDNITLSALDEILNGMFISNKQENNVVNRQVKKMNIKVSSVHQRVNDLSGGNQQKVVLAKVLLNKPEVLMLDEPTRGIDIGAKAEIYRLILQLAQSGKAIILISSELPEILGLCDRVLVIHEGKIKAELSGREATQEIIMKYAMT